MYTVSSTRYCTWGLFPISLVWSPSIDSVLQVLVTYELQCSVTDHAHASPGDSTPGSSLASRSGSCWPSGSAPLV